MSVFCKTKPISSRNYEQQTTNNELFQKTAFLSQKPRFDQKARGEIGGFRGKMGENGGFSGKIRGSFGEYRCSFRGKSVENGGFSGKFGEKKGENRLLRRSPCPS
jgi:hypothetical protein